MSNCSITADYKGEERYCKLSLVYANEEDHQRIEKAINDITPKYSLTPNIYTSDICDGRRVIVIEYHDDYDREAGKVFEEMMKVLDIESCECQ